MRLIHRSCLCGWQLHHWLFHRMNNLLIRYAWSLPSNSINHSTSSVKSLKAAAGSMTVSRQAAYGFGDFQEASALVFFEVEKEALPLDRVERLAVVVAFTSLGGERSQRFGLRHPHWPRSRLRIGIRLSRLVKTPPPRRVSLRTVEEDRRSYACAIGPEGAR